MNRTQKWLVGSIIFIIIMGVIVSTQIQQTNILVVEDVITGKITEIPTPNDEFVLGYIHSVLLTPAEEYFCINNKQELKLQKTIYESFGVGLPYSQQEDWEFEIVDGKFILYVDRTMEQINMIISPIPEHWIEVDGQKYELIEMVSKPEDAIRITAKYGYTFKI